MTGRAPITKHIEPDHYRYMAEVFSAMNSPALLIGCTWDHVHCLSRLSRTVTIAGLFECKFVQEVNREAAGAPRESQFSGGVPFNIEFDEKYDWD